jgi:hypothetical protein
MLTTQKLMPRLHMRLCCEILAAHLDFASTGAEVHLGLAHRSWKQLSSVNLAPNDYGLRQEHGAPT